MLVDVGAPVLFWQQRIGHGGRRFMLQKFRTLPPPFDWRGQPVPERKQLSAIGKFLRQTRFDELPQLLNVLVGDMSLIGPRPLLPEDQPMNSATRLMVRPGITGWAQVNGGKFLTPEEKDQYDEFYIRNASVWFDVRIIFMTLKVLFRFTVHSDHAVAAASVVGFGKAEGRHPPQAAHRSCREGQTHVAVKSNCHAGPLDVPVLRFPSNKSRFKPSARVKQCEPPILVTNTLPDPGTSRKRMCTLNESSKHLGRQGFQVYLPRYTKRRRHARRVDTVAVPLFPRYLFVSVAVAQRWHSIRSTIGITRLVANGDVRPLSRKKLLKD